MHRNLTTPQLQEIAENMIAHRIRTQDENLPGTHLLPTLYGCDGPSGSLSLAYETRPWMRNPMGVVHGGVVAILLDNAMGITSTCFYGQPTPTITLTINYARPVPLNTTVVVRTRTAVHGRTTAHLTAEIFLPDHPEDILVSGSGVYYARAAVEAAEKAAAEGAQA